MTAPDSGSRDDASSPVQSLVPGSVRISADRLLRIQGYTDPERLKLMGAVLARAGKECQVIILTCVPERYSHVGEATIVRLGGSQYDRI